MSAPRIRIVIVEDQLAVAECFTLYCRDYLGHEVVAVAHTGAEGVVALDREHPDVVLLDLGLPDMAPGQVLQSILLAAGRTKVIACTSLFNPVILELVEKFRLHGFLDKAAHGVSAFREAIQTVMAGGRFRPPGFREAYHEAKGRRDTHINVLSDREREVLSLVGDCRTDDQIAEILKVSPLTARVHRSRLMKKLHCQSTPELIAYATRTGFVQPGGGSRSPFSNIPGRSGIAHCT